MTVEKGREVKNLKIEIDSYIDSLLKEKEHRILFNLQNVHEFPTPESPGSVSRILLKQLADPESDLDTVIAIGQLGIGKTTWLTELAYALNKIRETFPDSHDALKYYSFGEQLKFGEVIYPEIFRKPDGEADESLSHRSNWEEQHWRTAGLWVMREMKNDWIEEMKRDVARGHMVRDKIWDKSKIKRHKIIRLGDLIGLRGKKLVEDNESGEKKLVEGTDRAVTAIEGITQFLMNFRMIHRAKFVFFTPDIRVLKGAHLRKLIASATPQDLPKILEMHKTLVEGASPEDIKKIALGMASEESIIRLANEVEVAAREVWNDEDAWKQLGLKREEWNFPAMPDDPGLIHNEWEITQMKAFHLQVVANRYEIPKEQAEFVISPYMDTPVRWRLDMLKVLTNLAR